MTTPTNKFEAWWRMRSTQFECSTSEAQPNHIVKGIARRAFMAGRRSMTIEVDYRDAKRASKEK